MVNDELADAKNEIVELKKCLSDLLASYADLKNLCGNKLPHKGREPIELWALALIRAKAKD